MSDSTESVSTSSGISFKLKSTTGSGKLLTQSSSVSRAAAVASEDDHHDNQRKDYLLSVEDKQLNSVVPKPRPKEYLIPLIRTNIWREPIAETGATPTKRDTVATPSGQDTIATPTGNETKDLEQLATEAILKDVAAGKFLGSAVDEQSNPAGASGGLIIPLMKQNKPPVQLEEGKLNDLPFRPEESSIDDYLDMPIEHYGSAMLKGMGWKPGQPIGLNKKGLVEPIEYIPHPGGLGLGATPRPPDPKKAKNRIKKPGEIEIKRPLPYKDKDGRIKHVKKIGEEIPEHKPEGFYMGNFAQIQTGPHQDLYGKIVAVDEANGTVVLKLAINNENLKFNQSSLGLVSEEEYRRYGRSTGHRQRETVEKEYGLITKSSSPQPSSGSSSSNRKRQTTDSSAAAAAAEGRTDKRFKYLNQLTDDTSDNELRSKTNGHGRDRHKTKEEHRRNKHETAERHRKDKHETMAGHRRDKHETTKRHRRDKHQTSEGQDESNKKYFKAISSEEKESNWLVSNLKVRVIDKEFKRGRYYNSKVKIVDVIDMDTCICQTSEGKLLEGISQGMLETIIPKSADSVIMIVKGDNKGQVASIVKRDGSQCQALVRVMQSDDLLTLDYDSICEYTGEETDPFR